MTTRPTTLVESDQLAQAAANVIRNEDFVPKGKRWPFARVSKVQRDYERAVSEISARRRQVRQEALEQKVKKERAAVDSVFSDAKERADAIHRQEIAEAKRPFDETEAEARALRDAAVAAANQAYQQAVDSANRVYVQEAAVFDQKRDAVIAEAKGVHDEAYAALEAQRERDLAQIAKDLSTIALEGLMRIVEDKEAWSPDERKKALIALVDMAGREDSDAPFADLCLRNVAGYVYQDRFLRPEHQQHRLMDVALLEALVELARRTADKRPTIVSYLYDIVQNNPGHSSPAFIKALTELYVIASADAESVYDPDAQKNEQIFESMRAHIADTLKVTPRRSQVPPAPTNGTHARTPVKTALDDHETPVLVRHEGEDITSDVDMGELLPVAVPPPVPKAALVSVEGGEAARAETAPGDAEAADTAAAESDEQKSEAAAPPAADSAPTKSEPAAVGGGRKSRRVARSPDAGEAAGGSAASEPTAKPSSAGQREESRG